MKVEIDFWGGPKDGEKVISSEIPEDMSFWIDQNCVLDSKEFLTTIKDDPRRTIKYHFYQLEQIDHLMYKYVFKGYV